MSVTKFETMKDITDAVDRGDYVLWKTTDYVVCRDSIGQYLIICQNNGDTVGLFHIDKVSTDYAPEEFWSVTVHYSPVCGGMAQCDDETPYKTVTDVQDIVTCEECKDIARSYYIY